MLFALFVWIRCNVVQQNFKPFRAFGTLGCPGTYKTFQTLTSLWNSRQFQCVLKVGILDMLKTIQRHFYVSINTCFFLVITLHSNVKDILCIFRMVVPTCNIQYLILNNNLTIFSPFHFIKPLIHKTFCTIVVNFLVNTLTTSKNIRVYHLFFL